MKLLLLFGSDKQVPDDACRGLFERISGHLLAGAIEADDPAFAIQHHDQRAHRVENRGDDIALFLQRFFGPLQVRNVEGHAVNEPRLPSACRIILASQWNQTTCPSRAITR